MATICHPILLIGSERVVYIGGDIGMCIINGAKSSSKRIVDITCERCKNYKSEDQDEKSQDDIGINRALSFSLL